MITNSPPTKFPRKYILTYLALLNFDFFNLFGRYRKWQYFFKINIRQLASGLGMDTQITVLVFFRKVWISKLFSNALLRPVWKYIQHGNLETIKYFHYPHSVMSVQAYVAKLCSDLQWKCSFTTFHQIDLCRTHPQT